LKTRYYYDKMDNNRKIISTSNPQAAAGEIVISEDVAQKAGIDTEPLEMRMLELKGKSDSMKVWVIKVSC
jgi:hypothetical protein